MRRYNYACTFLQNNTDVQFAPAPDSKVIPKFLPGTGNAVSVQSSLTGPLSGEAVVLNEIIPNTNPVCQVSPFDFGGIHPALTCRI